MQTVYFSALSVSPSLLIEMKCAYLDGLTLGAILAVAMLLDPERNAFSSTLAKQHFIERCAGDKNGSFVSIYVALHLCHSLSI